MSPHSRSSWLYVLCVCAWLRPLAAQAPAEAPAIPPHNRADQREPPPRPAAAGAEAQARVLFDAIAHDDPARARPVFFPRDAFLLVKDIPNPGRYFDRLWRRFESDVHALYKTLRDPAGAAFERFELAKRGGFVRVREEGNRLPYWAARHSYLYYRDAGRSQRFEVRVLITWDDRWYVIHLNEFH
ncbi:MAG TPA: hypothetical protein VJR89_05510 [Polyangiales bacterium]|nr:hypothetical protein [Polyangiales bacterium]